MFLIFWGFCPLLVFGLVPCLSIGLDLFIVFSCLFIVCLCLFLLFMPFACNNNSNNNSNENLSFLFLRGCLFFANSLIYSYLPSLVLPASLFVR